MADDTITGGVASTPPGDPTSSAQSGQYERTATISPPVLITYRDLLDHLRDYSGSLAQGPEQSRARAAIQNAYRAVYSYKPWKYYNTIGRVDLEPAQSTGTVSFSTTTGVLTLTGDTFPTSARYWRIKLEDDSNVYQVAEYLSPTTVLLDPVLRPSDTVTDSTFTMWRSIYPLPGDITKMTEINDQSALWGPRYIEPSEWLRRETVLGGSSEPFYWTILSSQNQFAGMSLAVHGYPSTDGTDALDFLYFRAARRLRFDGYKKYSSDGTATIGTLAADSMDVTITPGGDAVDLREDIVDAVFRTSDSGEEVPPEDIGSEHQFSEQQIISAWQNTTQFTLRAPMSYGKLGDHFTISDPVDVAPYMITLLKRRCEYEYEVLRQDATASTIASRRYDKEALKADALDVRMIPTPSVWRGWQADIWAYLNPYS